MKGAYILYKCRLCGETTKEMHAPDYQACLISIVTGNSQLFKKWGGMIPKMHDLHYCKDGRCGITDLVGAEPDKD